MNQDDSTIIEASLIGGQAGDNTDYTWTLGTTEIALTSNGHLGYINTFTAAGIYKVVISHPKALLDKEVTNTI